jgi:fructose 1,6-bisphosphatase
LFPNHFFNVAEKNLKKAKEEDSKCTAFDGPSRTVALGFQVANGEIANDDNVTPMMADMFGDPAFSQASHEAIS